MTEKIRVLDILKKVSDKDTIWKFCDFSVLEKQLIGFYNGHI